MTHVEMASKQFAGRPIKIRNGESGTLVSLSCNQMNQHPSYWTAKILTDEGDTIYWNYQDTYYLD